MAKFSFRITVLSIGIWVLLLYVTRSTIEAVENSIYITGVNFGSPLVIADPATGSDLWVSTWLNSAAGGDLLTVFGDGTGFVDPAKPRLSMGLAKIGGSPPTIKGINFTTNAEFKGDGRTGKKASGIVAVGSTVYMFVRNANLDGTQCQFAYSTDNGKNWTFGFIFEELGYCSLVNYGQAYLGARDGYLYMFSPNTNDAYRETDDLVLARVSMTNPGNESSWQFFAGKDASGNPLWGSIAQRKSVLNDPGGINRHDVTYNSVLGRYLMTMRSSAQNGGQNQFSLYEAPEPWGEWRRFYKTTAASSWGESQHIPSKWISGDGKTIYIVHSGNDKYNVLPVTLNVVNGTFSPTPAPKATNTVTPTTTVNGDANGDGSVNELDYAIWKTNYDTTATGGVTKGDFNLNGKVDGVDYLIWIQSHSG